MTQDKPVALWSVPRSISTAFERVFVERDDFEVFHEPFADSYYYSEERLSDRYGDQGSRPEDNYENVLARLLKPHEKRVFVKDMAYQAKPLIGSELVSRFRNTFIVRDPKYVIASLGRMWPDFTLEETGFEQLYRLFRYATELEDVVVVDAMTFSENPVGILAAYCEHLEIPFQPDDLSWQPGEVREWENWNWEGWHEKAQQSSGIKPAERKDPELPPEFQEAYEYCLPYYYELAARAIPGTAPIPPA